MRWRRLPCPGAAAVAAAALLAAVAAAASVPAAAPRSAASGQPSASPAAAAARPSFSGTWKLNPTRSSFGKMPGTQPRSRTDVIEHRDPHLTETLYLVRDSGKDTTRYRYLTDSSESLNRVDGQEIKTRVWWDGGVLRLDSRTRIVVIDATLKDHWSLSADGKTLTMRRRMKSALGEGDQTLVFEKQ